MSTNAFTIPEALIASAIGAMVILTAVTMMTHLAQSSKAVHAYSQFEQQGRMALDLFTRDVRQANNVSSFASNAIVLASPKGLISYTFVPEASVITRQDTDTFSVPVRNCLACEFTIFQRNPPLAAYGEFITTTDLAQAKLVEVTWQCGTTNANGTINSSTTQSARVVIRKL